MYFGAADWLLWLWLWLLPAVWLGGLAANTQQRTTHQNSREAATKD
jgi:hypothetical protein